MTPEEAAQLITVMTATWPNPPWKPEQAKMWRIDLEPLDAEDAAAALVELRNTERFCPTWAVFHDVYKQKRHQSHLRGADERGLPVAAASPAGLPLVMRLRDIQVATGDQHDHKRGALNCPVCKLHDHDDQGRHRSDCERCRTTATALTA